jgi:hypothetical protein
MISKHVAVMSVVIWGLTLWASPSQAELGGTHWSEADIADLNADLVILERAQHRLDGIIPDNRLGVAREQQGQRLAIARQKQLLGSAEDDEVILDQAVRDWWKANIIDPGMRIAENPAAPCKVAQVVLTKLVQAERQAQLAGIAGGPEGDITNPDSVMSQVFKAIKRRCLEQAYDACMASGNGQHIILMLAEASRQFQLLTIADGGFEAQAIYLYRRCTVYQLRYHSQSKLDGGWFAIGSDSDGSIILLSDVDPSQGYAGLQQPHEWIGPRPDEPPRPTDPIDALGVTTVCEVQNKGIRLVCESPVATGKRGLARIKAGDFAMERSYDEIEIHEWDVAKDGLNPPPPITWKRKTEGTNALSVAAFSPWPLQIPATFRYDPRLPPVSVPVPDSLIAFTMAHQKDKAATGGIEIKGWTHAGYNVLFTKTFPDTLTDQKIVYTDTTRFELVHRPDLFPPDEIVANWELTPAPQAPAATRKPLRPPTAPQ